MNRAAWKRAALLGGVAVAASAATFVAVRARAAGVPDAAALTYTGYLENPDGSPVTGKKSIGLFVYDAEVDGNEVCGLKPADVEPVAGRFQLALPEKCTTAVKSNPELWVEIMVEGALLGRTKLGAVPYALEANHATKADNAPAVSEWKAFVPKWQFLGGAFQAPVGSSGFWRRVGDTVHVQAAISDLATLSPGAGMLRLAAPENLVVDASKLAGNAVVGTGRIGNYHVDVRWGAANKSFYLDYADAGGGSSVTDSAPFVLTSGGAAVLLFSAPVVGWTTTAP